MEWKDNIITHLKLAEAQTVSDNVAFHFCYDHKKVISGLHLKSDDNTTPKQPITEEITQQGVRAILKDQNSSRMILALNRPLQWVILTEHLWPWPWVWVPDLTQFQKLWCFAVLQSFNVFVRYLNWPTRGATIKSSHPTDHLQNHTPNKEIQQNISQIKS